MDVFNAIPTKNKGLWSSIQPSQRVSNVACHVSLWPETENRWEQGCRAEASTSEDETPICSFESLDLGVALPVVAPKLVYHQVEGEKNVKMALSEATLGSIF